MERGRNAPFLLTDNLFLYTPETRAPKQYFPKGSSFPACVTPARKTPARMIRLGGLSGWQSGRDALGHNGIIKVQELLNNRPGKKLGFFTPNEIFSKFVALQT